MPNQVLYADRSIECGADPICIGTIATFLPLFTVGVPLTLLLWMRQGFSETGKKKLRALCADDKEYAPHKHAWYTHTYWCELSEWFLIISLSLSL